MAGQEYTSKYQRRVKSLPGDAINQITKDPSRITISDIVRLYSIDREDLQTMRRAIKVDALPRGWKNYFLEQIKRLEKKFAR